MVIVIFLGLLVGLSFIIVMIYQSENSAKKLLPDENGKKLIFIAKGFIMKKIIISNGTSYGYIRLYNEFMVASKIEKYLIHYDKIIDIRIDCDILGKKLIILNFINVMDKEEELLIKIKDSKALYDMINQQRSKIKT